MSKLVTPLERRIPFTIVPLLSIDSTAIPPQGGPYSPSSPSTFHLRSLFTPRKKLQRKSSTNAYKGVLYARDKAVEEDRKGRVVVRIWEREISVRDVDSEVVEEKGAKKMERRGREVPEVRGEERETQREEVVELTPVEWPRWRIF